MAINSMNAMDGIDDIELMPFALTKSAKKSHFNAKRLW